MHFKITTVGFYDAQGESSIDFIFNQTEMTTLVCSKKFLNTVLEMKKNGLAKLITNVVCLDEIVESEKALADSVGITLLTYQELIDAGENSDL